jgi:P-type Ca2+ transporter type 2C
VSSPTVPRAQSVAPAAAATAASRLGLSTAEARQRLRQLGPNEIERERAVSPWLLLAEQFRSPVIWLLFGACLLAAVLRELVDAIAIGAIVIVNALVGFFQEYRAERG